ncbi:MAG TPA: hypothetical protein VGB92_12520 [Longimicrobium sp.]|jgi:hypothetical protein
MIGRIRFVPLVCLAACGVQKTTSGIDGAMEAYVPGLQLDTPVSRADPRYRLAVVPELGPLVVYSDTAYRHASGMRGLLIATDQILFDTTQRPSPDAHIRSIALSTADAKVAHQVEQDLRGRLGEPRAWCLQSRPGQQNRLLHWGGTPHPTVSLSIPNGAWQPPRDTTRGLLDTEGRAWLSFAAEPPDTAQLQSRACPKSDVPGGAN